MTTRRGETAKPTKQEVRPGFWRGRTLEDFSPDEWEALCDGCGKCCLVKLEEEETLDVFYTDVSCRLFDPDTCRCGAYALRHDLVSACVRLTPASIRESLQWMPTTCAYRLIAEGRELEPWHPLVSGDPMSVHQAGVSMRGRVTPEYDVHEDDLWDYAHSTPEPP